MVTFLKILAGFVIFFTGVFLNVLIMKDIDGKPKGFLPPFSYLLIVTGLILLVVMINTVSFA